MNKYQKQQQKIGFLGSITQAVPTEKSLSGSAIETAKDLGVGVIGGGIVGAAIGKGSLLFGIATTFAGHYFDQRLLQAFGFGLMAAHTFQTKTTLSGLEGLSGAKERVLAFKDSFSEKLFLDKIFKKNQPVSGLGEVQYFSLEDDNQMGELDLTPLDNLQHQVRYSGQDFQHRSQMSGTIDDSSDYSAYDLGESEIIL